MQTTTRIASGLLAVILTLSAQVAGAPDATAEQGAAADEAATAEQGAAADEAATAEQGAAADEAATAEQEATGEEAAAWAWTGATGSGPVEPLPDADELLVDVARAGLAIAIDRDLEGAGARLLELWVRAARSEAYPRQMDVLAALAEARGRLFLEESAAGRARRALEQLWLGAEEVGALTDRRFVAATPAQRAVEREALARPHLADLRARVAPPQQESDEEPGLLQAIIEPVPENPYQEPDERLLRADIREVPEEVFEDPVAVQEPAGIQDVLRAEIERELARANHQAILPLGAAAVPALEALAQESAGKLLMHEMRDPLYYLAQLDETATARIVQEVLARGEAQAQGYTPQHPLYGQAAEWAFFWQKRALRAMRLAEVLSNEGTWSKGEPTLCQEPEWLVVLERAAGDPDLFEDAWPLLDDVLAWDTATPALQALLVEALQASSARRAARARELLARHKGKPAVQPVFEAVLESEEGELAEFAAWSLLAYADVGRLREQADHPHAAVRAALAQSFRVRIVLWEQRRVRVNIGHNVRRAVHPTTRAGDAGVLTALLADADASVRREALSSAALAEDEAGVLSSPLGADVPAAALLRLTEDPDVLVRRTLAWAELPDAERMTDVLARLCADPHPEVLDAVDHRLGAAEALDPSGPRWPASHGQVVRVLKARRDRARADGRAESGPGLQNAFLGIARDPVTFAQLARWTAATGDPELIALLALAFQQEPRRALSARGDLSTEEFARLLGHLALAEQVRPAELQITLHDKTTSLERIVDEYDEAVESGSPPPFGREAFLVAATTGELPPVPRMWCLFAAVELAPADLAELFLATLRDPVWASWGQRGVRRPADMLWRSVRTPELRLAIARDRAVPDEAAWNLVGALSTPMDPETIEAILARWLDDPEAPGVVSFALVNMGDHPDVADRALLEREALGERYPRAAVAAIGRLREPALYPVLARCLDPRWLPHGTVREGVRSAALESLVGTFDDEAAGLLLDELERSDDEEFRAVLIAGLQTMRTYRQEREVWRRRLELADMRRDTVEALMALASPVTDGGQEPPQGVRADALRALGSLGATEAMPLILDALQSPSATLRSAAREALEALYREPERAVSPRVPGDGGDAGDSGSTGETPGDDS